MLLAYFKKCLQEWIKSYFLDNAHKNHFTFMQAKGSVVKDKSLKVDESYAFWEASHLYNEMGDFLWDNPAQPIIKLTQSELKWCLFKGQPKKQHQQFEESLNASKPDDMNLEELKEHFKIKEDNAAHHELKNLEDQQWNK